jgi:hypothetical protein
MRKHNDRSTSLNNMEETFSYLDLQSSYDIDSAKIMNLLSSAEKQWNTCRTHLVSFRHCKDKPFFRCMSSHVNFSRQPHFCAVCKSVKLTSLRDTSEDVWIPNTWQLFYSKIEDDWGRNVSGLVLAYDKNIRLDSLFSKPQNGLLFNCQPFHCPISV